LLYNETLSDLEWIKKYDKRASQAKSTDIKAILGLSLIASSGMLLWGWWEWKQSSISLNNNNLGITASLKF